MTEFFGTPIGRYGLVLIQVVSGLLFFWLAQRLYQLLFRRIHLNEELFVRDNVAAAVALSGFFLGVLLALSGAATASALTGLDALEDFFYHAAAVIVFMLLGAFAGDRLILKRCDCFREICDHRNLGAGFVEGGTHVANGLLLSSALAGDSGSWAAGVVCWMAGMVVLWGAALVYPVVARFDVNGEIRNRNNVAAGIALAGFLVGVGNILRISLEGEFTRWQEMLPQYALTLAVSLLLMGLVRWLADLILVPGVTLSGEIAGQAVPNAGAGLIEAFCYIAASFLIGFAFVG
ncbi:DUF350 domain-containing protein [Geomonas sp. Red32]|uniref:DUF350 domain-containing protein n=1 Tax=Geomonas sp. Red32 TaxID=2912856 RepID=UPI00202CD6C6|nr:DUF350 domain-containing protein [Geomonas sp. Red32]MCM0083031.1 DUF350 domain-containing protein [Geomonas sp. Red32]